MMATSYALFDFDGTLMPGDSFVQFCRYAYQQGVCSAGQMVRGAWAGLRYVLGRATAEEAKMKALSFLQGLHQAEVYDLSDKFCRDVLRPRLFPQALEALNARRDDGATILLITASPAFYFEPIAAELGAAQVIGTRMDVRPDGVYTGLISGENCRGVQKPLRLAEYLAAAGKRLDYDTSYAYGNSMNDVPMLELCAHKVAVNAGRKMRRRLRDVDGAVFVTWRG